MRSALRLLLALVVVAGLVQLPADVGAQKPVTYQVVPLSVVVQSTMSDYYSPAPSPAAITEDGDGPYVDGVAGVEANIDKYGNLIINFDAGRVAQRWLNYNYVPLSTGQLDLNDPVYSDLGSYLSTISYVNGQYVAGPLQQMALPSNGQPARQCVPAALTRTQDFVHYFGRPVGYPADPTNPNYFPNSDTSPLLVTRTSDTTWEVETWPGASACQDAILHLGPFEPGGITRVITGAKRPKLTATDRGRYYLPFRMTLCELGTPCPPPA